MRPRAVVAAVLSLAVAAGAAQPVDAARDEGEIPTAGRFVEPVFDGVDVTRGVPYRQTTNARGEAQTLHMDLYEPAGDTADRRPVIVLIHGGFFTMGNNRDEQWGAGPSIAEYFVQRGYVAASIEYRLRPDMGNYPDVDLEELEAANLDAYDDSLAAVDWLRDRAAELRIDARAIVPNGPSAGGAVAWNLAWMQGSRARPEPSGVPAAVSISGAPFEVSEITGEPLAAPSPGDPPVLAVHGTADTIVGFDLAAGPCSRASAVGVRCDLVPLEGVGHPGVDSRFLDHVDAIGRRTIEFLANVVLRPLGYFDERPPDRPDTPDRPDRPEQAPPAMPVVARPAFTG